MDISATTQPAAATVNPLGVSDPKKELDDQDRVARKMLESAVDATKNSTEANRSHRRGERVDIEA